MSRIASALCLCILAGCAGAPPQAYSSACAAEPGSYACQIEQYERVSD